MASCWIVTDQVLVFLGMTYFQLNYQTDRGFCIVCNTVRRLFVHFGIIKYQAYITCKYRQTFNVISDTVSSDVCS
jgi:hypothetical protein